MEEDLGLSSLLENRNFRNLLVSLCSYFKSELTLFHVKESLPPPMDLNFRLAALV